MKNENKTCLDCLNCKVSVKSTEKRRMCFCTETKNRMIHTDLYWINRKLCDEFEDMTEKTTALIINPTVTNNKREPILKTRIYVSA
jgi:hypothetical protein